MSTVYALIKMDETARVLERAKDDDVAIDAIYLDELQRRLGVYGVTVVDVELTDHITGALSLALDELHLTQSRGMRLDKALLGADDNSAGTKAHPGYGGAFPED